MHKVNRVMLNPVVCTVKESKKVYKDLVNYKLNTVATHLGIPNLRHHNALNDARVSADILLCILGREPVATRIDTPMVDLYQRITKPFSNE
ncbi:exonuclease domain-containing protein [Peribacillus sp. NPDC097206]|uniref:exonuclease domain-containing protein n=1 Tax=unclassified Peribacillus TaxID=2675266 RepID=UPI003807606F